MAGLRVEDIDYTREVSVVRGKGERGTWGYRCPRGGVQQQQRRIRQGASTTLRIFEPALDLS
jgi:hypothetical protein